MNSLKRIFLCPSVYLFGVALGLAAQQSPVAAPPVPAKILTARSVFISNAGSDSGLFPHPFSGDPDRAYAQFLAGMQQWHRFAVTLDPASADLVLELRLLAPYGPSNPDKQRGASDPLPMFRLVVYDRPTHYVLWAITESIEPAIVQSTHDRNFDAALGRLMLDLKRVTGDLPPTPR